MRGFEPLAVLTTYHQTQCFFFSSLIASVLRFLLYPIEFQLMLYYSIFFYRVYENTHFAPSYILTVCNALPCLDYTLTTFGTFSVILSIRVSQCHTFALHK